MDFALNEQQEMLQKSARDFLTNEYSDKIIRELAEDEAGLRPELWQKMADLGWMALSLPEEYGGFGDFLDLAVVLEEMGRARFISPFFSTLALAAPILVEAGNQAQKQHYLSGIAEGRLKIALALAEASGELTPGSIHLQAHAQPHGYILEGKKLFVADAASADYFVVAAKTEGGLTLFLVDRHATGVSVEALKTISGDKQSNITFNRVEVADGDILGTQGEGWQYAEKALDRAAVGLCLDAVGGAKRVLEMTLAYAKERMAFGHPIGAFQAVQHRCADMLVDLEGCRMAAYQAAWKISAGLNAVREVAIARAWTGPAYRRIVTSAHQIHGSIGFTEDHVLHWYTRRARVIELGLGGITPYLDRLAKACS